MTRPEAAAFLAKARKALREARIVADNELPEAAGRAAYLAAYHAAQALVFARTGKTAKSHGAFAASSRASSRETPALTALFQLFWRAPTA